MGNRSTSLDSHGTETRTQAVTQVGQQGGNVTWCQVKGVDRQLEVVQRIAQSHQHLRTRRSIAAATRQQLAHGRRDVGSDAVMHIAQDAAALGQPLLVAGHGLHLRIRGTQGFFFFRHPRR